MKPMPSTTDTPRQVSPVTLTPPGSSRRSHALPTDTPLPEALTALRALIESQPVRSTAEQRQLAAAAQAGDVAARETLILANLRYVVRAARRYAGCGLPILDLIHDGVLGLTQAVDRFDPSRGASFLTCASWWIRREIVEAIVKTSALVRLPEPRRQTLRQLQRARRVWAQQSGQPASDAVLAAMCGVPLADVVMLQRHDQPLVELDAPAHDDAEGEGGVPATVGECLLETMVPACDDADDEVSRVAQVRAAFHAARLSPQAVTILEQHYGLAAQREPMTLLEIGEVSQLSRERIRQIRNAALEQIRQSPRAVVLLHDMAV